MKRISNFDMIKRHIDITTIHKRHRTNMIIGKIICFSMFLLILGYLAGCLYVDWAGMYE